LENSGSLDDKSESEEELATKPKSRVITALKNSEGKAQKHGVQFQKSLMGNEALYRECM